MIRVFSVKAGTPRPGSVWLSVDADASVCKGSVETVGLEGGGGVAARPKRDAKEVERRDDATGGVLVVPRLTARAFGRGGRGGFAGEEGPPAVGRGGSGREAWCRGSV